MISDAFLFKPYWGILLIKFAYKNTWLVFNFILLAEVIIQRVGLCDLQAIFFTLSIQAWAVSVDLDEKLQSAAFDQGLHRLLLIQWFQDSPTCS